MKTAQRRELLAEGVIVAGLIVGGYSVFVDPLHEQWRHLASLTIDEASHAALRLGDPSAIASERALVRQALTHLTALEVTSRIARDELSAIESITDLARECAVEIMDLRRRDIEDEADVPTMDASGSSTAARTQSRRIGFELEIRGCYGGLAHFASRIESGFGVSSIDSMTLIPEGDRDHPIVRASMATRHIVLNTQAARKALTAADEALHQLEQGP